MSRLRRFPRRGRPTTGSGVSGGGGAVAAATDDRLGYWPGCACGAPRVGGLRRGAGTVARRRGGVGVMWAARECTTSTATTCSVLLLHHRHSLRSRTHDWPLVHRPRHAQRLVHCIVEVSRTYSSCGETCCQLLSQVIPLKLSNQFHNRHINIVIQHLA